MSEQNKVSQFIQLMNSHQVRLRGFALSLIPHWADAEEVLQEASLIMWTKFDQFEIGTSFFSWACRIIHIRAKELRRRQARSKIRFTDEFLELISDRTIQLEQQLAEREELLNDCVSKLKQKHREMLRLRYQQGLSVERLAETAGSSAKAVYQALSRIHKALFECVERRLAGMGH
jgi:RNA polymerase sigma-70 factor (ECF subfamily)